jgi:hypothetical protein
MEWGAWMALGTYKFFNSTAGDWDADVARFFAELRRFDDVLAGDAELAVPCEKLFQGAIADSLTHVGQLTMLRRLAGAPIRGENYSKADIATGRTGIDQAAPRVEFD